MTKPSSSLLTKILAWFFLNLVLSAALVALFFFFQPRVNFYTVFGQQISNRLRTAGMLIAHDLNENPRKNWHRILTRHQDTQQVNFALVLADGFCFSSTNGKPPKEVIMSARKTLALGPPPGEVPPHIFFGPQSLGPKTGIMKNPIQSPPPLLAKPHLIMKTRNPKRYWTGIKIPLLLDPSSDLKSGLLLVSSNSITGNGFFFDPLPWMMVAGGVLLISVLLWIPLVRNITNPLGRMTLATEEIARGGFDVTIHEPRTDEIGRLAKAINHMTSRLSAFVRGQRRFLGDVSHELGSPISRIQMGLAILEQRTTGENQIRVKDVLEDVDQLAGLVNELLAFSRAEINRKSVKLDIVSLHPLVQEVINREDIGNINILNEVAPDILVRATADLLTRAVANLIRNAAKYAGTAGPVQIFAEKRKENIALIVRDSGPGVPETMVDQLFEPFFRPESSRNRDSGGVGLGLAIVKTCVETCQGTVSACNGNPNGFTVTILLKKGV
ncbi:Signal transduction histidine kinase [Desulforapulum autotrophicum HRM2]|uniref:histidine kinase n=1 Tax=Desulforapulum autotrophicum (strain ATCC 43914 / DSM 3382 / VKM B-1955 / HRM2) TaxID=177437 RepID=C0QG13_DESAH|nr:HAMP domain-containing sensor histidine kinase [Desulforapulum autotrophicum]ACN17592.1 Signal transduction histidine kinase [Desulforapulum autotrophicum HRM2]